MELARLMLLFIWIAIILVFLKLSNVEGRAHYHKKPKSKNSNKGSPVSQSPANPPIPSDPYDPGSSCVFNVMFYGAVGDGSTDDTEAFRSAWNAACAVESGVLLAPSDYTFTITSTIFSGPCKPNLVFQVDGVLMPPDGPDCWPEGDSDKQWLVFYRLDGMTFTGTGTIEGNGEKWWELPCKPHRGPNGTTLPGPCDSPALIRFFMSSNLAVTGIRIQNSPQFHMKLDGCTGVSIDQISISSPALSPNTDGIHIENTKSVGIYNSMISNGDDCVSIGPGSAFVAIENITCEHSHGIRTTGKSRGEQESERERMPLPKYYCDYCDKQFQDTALARKRHLQGIQHQRARAFWYDSHKAPNQIQAQSFGKGVCNRFLRTWLIFQKASNHQLL